MYAHTRAERVEVIERTSGAGGTRKAAEQHYGTMPKDEICALPIADIARPRSDTVAAGGPTHALSPSRQTLRPLTSSITQRLWDCLSDRARTAEIFPEQNFQFSAI